MTGETIFFEEEATAEDSPRFCFPWAFDELGFADADLAREGGWMSGDDPRDGDVLGEAARLELGPGAS